MYTSEGINCLTYSYKDCGENIGQIPLHLLSDFRNKLLRRTRADGTVIECSYNADGDRVWKDVTGSDGIRKAFTRYTVDRNNHTGYAQVVEEMDIAGELRQRYHYGHDLVAIDRFPDTVGNPERSYYSYDGHGSIRSITDETGLITEEYDYDAFGVMIAFRQWDENTGLAGELVELDVSEYFSKGTNCYLYTGEQFDRDLGQYYLRARYLNPQSGRFHTMDTYEGRRGEPITLHKYLYANGNGVSYVDPSGYFSLAQLGTASAIGAGLGGATGAAYGYALTGTLKGTIDFAIAGAGTGAVLAPLTVLAGVGVSAVAGVSEATGIFIAGSATNGLGIGIEGYRLATTSDPRQRAASALGIAFGVLGQTVGTAAFSNARAGRGTFINSDPHATAEELAVGRLIANRYGADIHSAAPEVPRGSGTADYRLWLRGGTAELKNMTSRGSGNSIVSGIASAQSDNVIVVVKPGQLSASFLQRLGGRLFGPNAPSKKNSVTVVTEDAQGSYNVIFSATRNGSKGLNR